LKFESNPESDFRRSFIYKHLREKKIRGVAIINPGGEGWGKPGKDKRKNENLPPFTKFTLR
jgi:hypothetical protein